MTATPGARGGSPVRLLDWALDDRVVRDLRDSAAAATWRAYRADLGDLDAWLGHRDWTDPAVIADYLRALEDAGAAYSTIERRVTAITKLANILALVGEFDPAANPGQTPNRDHRNERDPPPARNRQRRIRAVDRGTTDPGTAGDRRHDPRRATRHRPIADRLVRRISPFRTRRDPPPPPRHRQPRSRHLAGPLESIPRTHRVGPDRPQLDIAMVPRHRARGMAPTNPAPTPMPTIR